MKPAASPLLAFFLALVLAGCCAACSDAASSDEGLPAQDGAGQGQSFPQIAVFTSLPIFFGESDDIAASLLDEAPAHWALAALQDLAGEVRPLDTLAGLDRADGARGADVLLLIQPRALSAGENLALDRWVRGGGALVLFADPMLDPHSIFAPGDPRRPRDVALLSPILARWGLELFYDAAQDPAERRVALPEGALPVRLAGHFAPLGTDGGGASGKRGDGAPIAAQASGDGAGRCRFEAQGLIARCRIGKGRVLLVADASLFENPVADASGRAGLLQGLIARIAPSR